MSSSIAVIEADLKAAKADVAQWQSKVETALMSGDAGERMLNFFDKQLDNANALVLKFTDQLSEARSKSHTSNDPEVGVETTNHLKFLWTDKEGFQWEPCASFSSPVLNGPEGTSGDCPGASTTVAAGGSDAAAVGVYDIESQAYAPTATITVPAGPSFASRTLQANAASCSESGVIHKNGAAGVVAEAVPWVPEQQQLHTDESVHYAFLSTKARAALPFLGSPSCYYWPLFRRASHDRLIDQVIEAICLAMHANGTRLIRIMGPPGIGKTVSLVLVLAEAAKLGFDIVCHVQGSNDWNHYAPDGTLRVFHGSQFPASLDSLSTLVLYDPAKKFDLAALVIKRAVVCLAASPMESSVKDLFVFKTFYTYSWSDAEFPAVLTYVGTQPQFNKQSRDLFGNNFRALLFPPNLAAEKLSEFSEFISTYQDESDSYRQLNGSTNSLMGFKLSLPAIGQPVSFTEPDPSNVRFASKWYSEAVDNHLNQLRVDLKEKKKSSLLAWVASTVLTITSQVVVGSITSAVTTYGMVKS